MTQELYEARHWPRLSETARKDRSVRESKCTMPYSLDNYLLPGEGTPSQPLSQPPALGVNLAPNRQPGTGREALVPPMILVLAEKKNQN